MIVLTSTLVHLASMIDAKQNKLEKTQVPFVRRQIIEELEVLSRRFEVEFQQFAVANDGRARADEG